MQIRHFTRDSCLVVALTGQITVATAPQIQRELLKDLGEGPLTIICDLEGVDALDPVCATVFATVANRPVSRWPAASLLLCSARPAVAKVLGGLRVRHVLPLYDTLQEAVDAAGARPGYLRDELRLAPTPSAAAAARRFVRDTLQSWALGPPDEEPSEQAQLLADELVTNAVVHAQTDMRLRLELGGELLHIAVHDQDRRLPRVRSDDPEVQGGRGLRLVEWVAAAWGAQPHPGGGKVVWCTLQTLRAGRSGPAAREMPLPVPESKLTPPLLGPGMVPPPDGAASSNGWLALLRALMCRHGVEQLRSDAELACKLVPTGSLLRAPAVLLLGVSYLLVGDLDSADGLLAEAVEVAEDTGAADTAAVGLAERALVSIDRGAWEWAELLVEQGRSLLNQAYPDDPVTSVLLYAVAARLAVHQGAVPRAHDDLAHAQRLRPQLTIALPIFALQARLELVRAHLGLTDVAGAGTVLREVDQLLRRRPQLGVLGQQADQLRAQVDAMRADVLGASSLTAAELRLLPLLATHLTFREISKRLHVSSNTVKTQTMSIYRKLGVSSRSQAIDHAQQLGLLPAEQAVTVPLLGSILPSGRTPAEGVGGGRWRDVRRAHEAGRRRRGGALTMAGIELRSPSFGDHQPIPARHAKDHDNLSPTLEWSGVPQQAVELAVLCEDPDAPGGSFTHWVLAGLEPTAPGLAEGERPAAAVEGRNDFGEDGYSGPLPPVGDGPHRYLFRVFAASAPLGLTAGASAQELRHALAGKELASSTLVGTYQR